MDGTFNGEPGWSSRVLTADAGSIGGAFDTFRATLTDPSGALRHDTSDLNPERPGGDFPSISNCNGGARAEVDAGNVRIELPD